MKYVFIHGYMSNPNADWYPAITKKLEALGHKVSIPAMPGHRHPKAEEWLKIIGQEIDSKDVVLVGHSLGTRAIALYLDQNEPEVKRVFLIAPPDINDHPKSDNAWHKTIDFKKFERWDITVLASKDDEIVPFEGAKNLANKLGAELIETDGHGHFTKPEDAEVIFEALE